MGGQCSYGGVLLKKVDENSIKMDPILWNSLLRLGTMKYWKLARGVKWMSDISSSEEMIEEMEKRLLASKAAPSTVEKTITLCKSEEIEALLFGAINSALPNHAMKYYNALLARKKEYKFTDHYKAKFAKLVSPVNSAEKE